MHQAGVNLVNLGDLLVGAGAAGRGQLGLGLDGRGPRPAPRRRHRGRPRYGHLLTAALAHDRSPRDPAGHRRRHDDLARRAPALAPLLAGLPRATPLDARADAWPSGTREPPGPGACGTSTTSSAATTHDDYSDDAAVAFRAWLETEYGNLDALNAAWGTAFWSQRYSAWDQLLPPRVDASFPNPTQQPRLQALLLLGPAGLPARGVGRPARGHPRHPGHDQLHGHGGRDRRHGLCRVGKRSRPRRQRPLPHRARDRRLRRALLLGLPDPGIAGDSPGSSWSTRPARSTGSPSTRRRRRARCGATASPTSRTGPTRCRSSSGAPRPGRRSSTRRCCPTQAPTPSCSATSVHSAPTWHGCGKSLVRRPSRPRSPSCSTGTRGGRVELDSHPSTCCATPKRLSPGTRCSPSTASRSTCSRCRRPRPYLMVVAPMLHVIDEPTPQRLTSYVEGGGHLVTTFFSGIVDQDDHVYLGGYPGALRELLGVRVEEFGPLLPGGRRVAEGRRSRHAVGRAGPHCRRHNGSRVIRRGRPGRSACRHQARGR